MSEGLNKPQQATMVQAIRELRRTGHPQEAQWLQVKLDAGEYDPEARQIVSGVRPEKKVTEDAPLPPRTGRGSSRDAWVRFALANSGIDEAVIRGVTRDDLINMLEARGVIDKELPKDKDD